MTEVFVVNSGSSSIKYELVDPVAEVTLLEGLIERIGEPGGVADHAEGMQRVLEHLGGGREIAAVGHRVVHGGSQFTAPTLITAEVVDEIEALSDLAPLHNPANVLGIRAAMAALPGAPHVAVFDTAFHHTLAPQAYTYAIDAALAAEHGVRRYGFHGTSHEYVSRETARFLERPLDELKTIVLHLGNGASATAVDGGRSVETSMGMTPLEGLVMGTRGGDIDPGVLVHLARVAGLGVNDIDHLLNRRSGLVGLTGTRDFRDVVQASEAGEPSARLAFDIAAHRLKHYVGAYFALLGGVDAIAFTAGVGENSAPIRAAALDGIEELGIVIDPARNESPSRDARRISADNSAVEVLVIPTDEELEIARQALALVT